MLPGRKAHRERENLKLRKWEQCRDEPEKDRVPQAEQENRNGRMEAARHQDQTPRRCRPWPHRWVSCGSELPSSSTSSKPLRGCPLFTAVEVRVGEGGTLFSCRLSSWDEETSSLCRLEGPARHRCACAL